MCIDKREKEKWEVYLGKEGVDRNLISAYRENILGLS